MITLPFLFRRAGGLQRTLAFVGVLAAGWSLAVTAAAAEVKVLTAARLQPVVAAMAGVFEQRTGHKLLVVQGGVEGLAKRIREGEDFDLAVLPPQLLETLGQEGAVADGSITPLAKVPAGRPAPELYAGALSASAASSQAALTLLILLASEETQAILKDKGLAAP